MMIIMAMIKGLAWVQHSVWLWNWCLALSKPIN